MDLLFATGLACAQFAVQDSHTSAGLRGIDAVSAEVAWASGSEGTVLRTLDGGTTWQRCAVPVGAEKLDFRGVQALAVDTAVVMSSGPGARSRVYKTTDGCGTWKLVFTDPDEAGFFDAIRRVTEHQIYLLGDPVRGRFAMFVSRDAGETWSIADDPGLDAVAGDGAFAASNSALTAAGATLFFASGGTNVPEVYALRAACPAAGEEAQVCSMAWTKVEVPLAGHAASAGAFSLAARTETAMSGRSRTTIVAVGGVYDRPTERLGTAAVSVDSGRSWRPATVAPGGYRSAVAFDGGTQTWLAVGPSGADLSRDNGVTWSALGAGVEAAAETGGGWNAISLPFVVGAKGRIGRLREGALTRREVPRRPGGDGPL